MIVGVILLMIAQTLVPGSSNTWTDGLHTWAGSPFCAQAGTLLSPDSPAIDAGTITEINCPKPGPTLTGCLEWYGKAPDIGACEYVPTTSAPKLPSAPVGLSIQ